MMTAYFDRTAPMFLTRDRGFDGYPVQVKEELVTFTEKVNKVLARMEQEFNVSGAPEDSAQTLASLFMTLMHEAMTGETHE